MKYSYTSSEGKGFPIIFLVTVIVLVIGGVAALFFTGYLRVGPSVATTPAGLCSGLIADYNKAFNQSNVDAYVKQLAASAREAGGVADSESDPTCVYMQFTNAVATQNKGDITKFAGILKSLADEGKYITGELANPLGVETITQTAENLSRPAEENLNNGTLQGNG